MKVETSTVVIKGKLATESIAPDDEIDTGYVKNRAVSLTTRRCSALESMMISRVADVADEYVAESRRWVVQMSFWFSGCSYLVLCCQLSHCYDC